MRAAIWKGKLKKKLMLYKAQEVAVQSVFKTSVFEFLTSTVERKHYRKRRGEEEV